MDQWRQARSHAAAATRSADLTALSQALHSEWYAGLDVSGLASSDVAATSPLYAERVAETMTADGRSRFAETTRATDRAIDRHGAALPAEAADRLNGIESVRDRVDADGISPAEVDLHYSRIVRALDRQLTAELSTITELASPESVAAVEAQSTLGALSNDAGRLGHELTLAVDRLLSGGQADWRATTDAVNGLADSSQRASDLRLPATPGWTDAQSRLIAAAAAVGPVAEDAPAPSDPAVREIIDALLQARADVSEAQASIIETQASVVAVVVAVGEAERSDARNSLLASGGLLVTVAALVALAVERASRSIVTPLQGAASAARQVSEGEIPDGVVDTGRGPAEVRAMSSALDDLVTTVAAIEAQAEAVNRGSLDDPVLSHRLPGQLGQSVEASLGIWRETTLQLEHELSHDSLTGVASRHHLLRLATELVGDGPIALALFGLDRFKEINDTVGQRVGDDLLRSIAQRIEAALPTDMLVARVWSDEFAVVAPGVSAETMAATADRVLDLIARPITLGRQSFRCRSTAGVATGDDADTLLAEATLALRHGKGLGGNQVVVYDDRFAQLIAAQAVVEAELGDALVNDDLELWLQPVLDLGARQIVGAEALIRWPQADGSMRLPGDFIPVAERTGLILDLDRWVLDRACQLLASWAGTAQADIEIAINVSARHLVDGDLVDAVFESCRRWSIDTGRLAIEITESYLAADLARTRVVLERLHELGVTLLLDDFGTGYSSLVYLQDLPFDVLKIDRAFIARMGRDTTSEPIVAALIKLGHDMGLSVLAEGIESPETIERLTELGCDSAQGFGIARPMPAHELSALISRPLNPLR